MMTRRDLLAGLTHAAAAVLAVCGGRRTEPKVYRDTWMPIHRHTDTPDGTIWVNLQDGQAYVRSEGAWEPVDSRHYNYASGTLVHRNYID